MTITRRTVCWAGATALIGTLGVALTGRTTEGYRGPTRTVRIAGGQVGGFYKEFAQVLAGEITSAEPNLRCEAIETGGSVSNIELIHHGRADIGVSQADIALAAVAGDDPFAGSVPICGIGRMYEDYLQLVVRDDSPVRTVRGLGGRTVSIGALGSGTAIFGKRLFDAVEVRITKRYQALPYAAAALERRQVDAVLWSGGGCPPLRSPSCTPESGSGCCRSCRPCRRCGTCTAPPTSRSASPQGDMDGPAHRRSGSRTCWCAGRTCPTTSPPRSPACSSTGRRGSCRGMRWEPSSWTGARSSDCSAYQRTRAPRRPTDNCTADG
jgi:hypothetical protein